MHLITVYSVEQLRELRKKCGLTQVELAGLSGVSQSDISKLERKEKDDPRFSIVLQLTLALNTYATEHGIDLRDNTEATAA